MSTAAHLLLFLVADCLVCQALAAPRLSSTAVFRLAAGGIVAVAGFQDSRMPSCMSCIHQPEPGASGQLVGLEQMPALCVGAR